MNPASTPLPSSPGDSKFPPCALNLASLAISPSRERRVGLGNLSFSPSRSCPRTRFSPGVPMKLPASTVAAAQRSAAAFALSSLLLLPTIGMAPPALADGDVGRPPLPPTQIATFHSPSWPSHLTFVAVPSHARGCTAFLLHSDQSFQIPANRPHQEGPLPLLVLGNGSSQCSA